MSSLAAVKAAFLQIAENRRAKLKNQQRSASVELQLTFFKKLQTPDLAWGSANVILMGMADVADAPLGCCTYDVDGKTFTITTTADECSTIPSSNFDPSGPCS
jgi:hypothetical protein